MLRRPPTSLLCIALTLATPAVGSAQGAVWHVGLNLGLPSFDKGGTGSNAYRLGFSVGAEMERPMSGALSLLLGLGYSQRRFGSSDATVDPTTGNTAGRETGNGIGGTGSTTFQISGHSYDFDYLEATALLRSRISGRVALDFGAAFGRLTHCMYDGDTPCFDEFFVPPFTANRLDYAGVLRLVLLNSATSRIGGFGLSFTQDLETTNGGTPSVSFAPGGGVTTAYPTQIQPRILTLYTLVRL